MADAVNWTRDLGNGPPNEIYPASLAESARRLAEEHKFEFEVLTRRDLEKKRMGGILGVGQGSAHEPRLMVLRYRGKRNAPPSVVVGKAITFDRRNLDQARGEHGGDKVRQDGRSGRARIMRAVSLLKLRINLVGIVPRRRTCREAPPIARATS
jgi:leucyl aminopeptidase